MPLSTLLLKGAKLAVKGTSFVSLVAVVNLVPIAGYMHFGPWSQKEIERGLKGGRYSDGARRRSSAD